VQLINNFFPFQNDVLATNELAKHKNNQICVDIALTELSKDVHEFVTIARSYLFGPVVKVQDASLRKEN